MEWTGERSGQYRGVLTAPDQGWYEARIEATRADKSVGTSVLHARSAPGDAEYFDATMHAPLLRRIAQETGGRFYTANATQALPDDVKYSGRGVTSVEERELWHMPVLLLAVVLLVCTEWGLRRAWRLA